MCLCVYQGPGLSGWATNPAVKSVSLGGTVSLPGYYKDQDKMLPKWAEVMCVAVCCRVLPCVAVCCRVLPCVAVCCHVLPCVAVCSRVLSGKRRHDAAKVDRDHVCVHLEDRGHTCVHGLWMCVRVCVCARVCIYVCVYVEGLSPILCCFTYVVK